MAASQLQVHVLLEDVMASAGTETGVEDGVGDSKEEADPSRAVVETFGDVTGEMSSIGNSLGVLRVSAWVDVVFCDFGT